MVMGFDGWSFYEKKIKTSKHEQISSYQWVISVSLFPPNCVAVVILRRFFIYDVNFVYNALCFLRLASRSSVNHIFTVLNKHFCILWSQNSPLFSLRHSHVSFYEPKELKISRYLIIDFVLLGQRISFVLPRTKLYRGSWSRCFNFGRIFTNFLRAKSSQWKY